MRYSNPETVLAVLHDNTPCDQKRPQAETPSTFRENAGHGPTVGYYGGGLATVVLMGRLFCERGSPLGAGGVAASRGKWRPLSENTSTFKGATLDSFRGREPLERLQRFQWHPLSEKRSTFKHHQLSEIMSTFTPWKPFGGESRGSNGVNGSNSAASGAVVGASCLYLHLNRSSSLLRP